MTENTALLKRKEDERKLDLLLAEQEKQVQNVLTVADIAINRTYLPECIHYAPVPMSQETISSTTFLSKSRLYKLTRFVYNPEDNVMEKLKIIFLALSQLPLNPSVFLVIHNERARHAIDRVTGEKVISKKGSLSLYFGIRTDSEASEMIGKMFQECFVNTFPGSELEAAAKEEYEKVEKSDVENIVCVSAMPSVKKDDDGKAANIGLEQFIDSMRNHDYTAFMIATPVAPEVVQLRKRELENFYSQLSVFRKQTLAFGENENISVSEGINKSFSKSDTLGKSVTETNGRSHGTTKTEGKSTSYGYNSSSGSSSGGGSSSSGSSSSYSTSESYSESETFSFSKSVGTSSSTTTGETEGKSETKGTSTGSSKTLTLERENKNIVCMLEKIDSALQRITEAEAYGLWECAAYFASKDTSEAVLAANSYKALVLGDQSSDSLSYVTTWATPSYQEQKDAVQYEIRHNARTMDEATARIDQMVMARKADAATLYSYISHGMHPMLHRDGGYEQFQNIAPTNAVSGRELPHFFNIPLKSLPGIIVDSIAAFERSVCTKKLDSRKTQKNVTIPLGCVFHMGNKDENTRVDLDVDSLTGHCFISGSTGSGKSNTMSKILEGLVELEHTEAQRKINFLVIEPAKGEYKKDFHEIPGVRIYTTNPLTEQLLHLNPFRFPDGIHVLEHIDRLLNIFGSCWELTAAMPAILKKAVEQAYETVGWDLCSSYYVGEGNVSYPTFASLVAELRQVIATSDYSNEAKGNYTGALVTRVESLASGILKKIFCSETEISYPELFDSRVIVDLSRLGSPETKSMIMGVLVMLLSEYRMAEAQKSNQTNKKLHHVTIIEEAHNLLKNVATIPGGSTLVSKSIEMISNAMAEMRTYGEGFIIVDQSPTAVDISAIKNTNTKIVMRLPEQSDCEAMANAMGMNENQQREIAKLLPGKAIVMQNNWVAAVMVAVDEAAGKFNGVPELITADANRRIRAVLASVLADFAAAQIAGGASFKGADLNKLLEILKHYARQYKDNRNSCIGVAKAKELFQTCEYYWNELRPDQKKTPGVIKRKYGQLITSVLECEMCWKNFQGKSPDPKAEFEGFLKRYIPLENAPMTMLADCILSFMRQGGVMLSGGTKVEAERFNGIFLKGEKHE